MRITISAWASALIVLTSPGTVAAQPVESSGTARLQRLVDDLGLQFRLTFRGQAVEHSERYEQLRTAVEAWNRSSRSDADLAVMNRWLLDAIRASMPGGATSMPAPPQFGQAVTTSTEALPAPTPDATGPSSVAEPPPAPTAAVKPTRPGIALDAHPATAELSWGNPFVDDPQPEDPQPGDEPPARTTRLKPVTNVENPIRVDVKELSARVRGYKQGLRFVEAELIGSPGASAFRLAGLTRELESLQSQRELLELYLDGLSEFDRMMVDDLPSPTPVVKMLKSSFEKRQSAVEGSNAKSASAEKAVLFGVERKLEELAKAGG